MNMPSGKQITWAVVVIALVLAAAFLGVKYPLPPQPEEQPAAAGVNTEIVRALTVRNDASVGGALAVTGATTLTGGIAQANVVLEGTTDDAYETTLAVTDPTADRTMTFPNETAAVMVSSLTTNATAAANAVTGASNGLVFEGATANEFETTLSATDPTADRSVVFADGAGTVMLSSLATNATDAANAVTGASNGLVWEGATANEFETSLTATDPTVDRTLTLPNLSGELMVSGGYDAADGWFASGQDFKYEGSTANNFEAILRAPGDPAADRIYSFPDFSGYVATTSSSLQMVFGSNTITGTLAVSHGLTTPAYALCTLGADPSNGEESHCSTAISGGTVTVKVWKEDVPAAGDSGILVYWLVAGTP